MSKFYDLREWRDVLRPAQLAREPLCKHCLEMMVVKAATEVDHIAPISEGGDPRDSTNLQSLCEPCHSRKTAVDNGKAVAQGCGIDGVPRARRTREHRVNHASTTRESKAGRGEVQTLGLSRDERRQPHARTATKPDLNGPT